MEETNLSLSLSLSTCPWHFVNVAPGSSAQTLPLEGFTSAAAPRGRCEVKEMVRARLGRLGMVRPAQLPGRKLGVELPCEGLCLFLPGTSAREGIPAIAPWKQSYWECQIRYWA